MIRPSFNKEQSKQLPTTLLVDGDCFLQVCYNGVHDSKLVDNQTGGVWQMLLKLRSIIETYTDINDIIVFWDGLESGNLRSEIYPDYKISRKFDKEKQQEKSFFMQQKELVKYLLDLIGLKQYQDNIVETDDCIAWYVTEYEFQNKMISSCDYDLLQLVDEKTVFYNLNKVQLSKGEYKKNHVITTQNHKLFYPYNVKNHRIRKIICGDESDDIFGVEGMAEKSFLKHFNVLLEQPIELSEIIAEAQNIQTTRGKKKLKAIDNLLNSVDVLKLNEKLIDLRQPFITEECKNNIKNLQSSELNYIDFVEAFNQLELTKELKNIPKYDGNINLFLSPFLRTKNNN